MVWNDEHITRWAKNGGVENFEPRTVNPASLDLRWSGRAKAARRNGWETLKNKKNGSDVLESLTMVNGVLYLLDTIEVVNMPATAGGMLYLKSSMGRIGLEHLHAGWFDPSFSGTATLEMENRAPWPNTITKGQKIVQLVLVNMKEAPRLGYDVTGRYNGQCAPQPAR